MSRLFDKRSTEEKEVIKVSSVTLGGYNSTRKNNGTFVNIIEGYKTYHMKHNGNVIIYSLKQ